MVDQQLRNHQTIRTLNTITNTCAFPFVSFVARPIVMEPRQKGKCPLGNSSIERWHQSLSLVAWMPATMPFKALQLSRPLLDLIHLVQPCGGGFRSDFRVS